jgi:DNA-nicking Smr family endonuclease
MDKGKNGAKGGNPGETQEDDDDARAWREETRGVRPLAKNTAPVPARRKPAAAGKRKKAESAPALPAPPPRRQPGGDSVDRRTAERLKRGEMKIEARLDLHGRTQDEAHAALRSFIAATYEAGRRCVLVITGKGRGEDGGPGVLQSRVPGWLREGELAALVLRCEKAQQKDGGAGALYVLLRRNRGRG